MYCSNCGKQLPEEAIFCGNCGVKVVGRTAPEEKQKSRIENAMNDFSSWSMVKSDVSRLAVVVLMGIAVVWSMISGLVPLVEGSIPFTLSVEWSLVNIWKDVEFLAEIGADAGMLSFVAGACMILYLIAVAFGGKFFYDLFAVSGRKDYMKGDAIKASIFSALATLVIIIGQSIINAETASYMIGLEFLSVLPTGWINLVVAILNIVVFANLFDRFAGTFMSGRSDGEEKECQACGTKYRFSTCCPNCGSLFVKK